MANVLTIASIPGEGIGKEVVPEGLRALRAATSASDVDLRIIDIEWASCDYFARHGQMMPDDWSDQLRSVDAIFLGAVGWPDAVPDHVSLWQSILKIRRDFDQFVNLRPAILFEEVRCPLADYQPGDIDFVVVRENTEGEYTDIGGHMYSGTEREIVLQQSVFSKFGSDRILRYAFELAQTRQRKQLTLATKSNGIAISMPWWDERADAIAEDFPGVKLDKQHIDILAARFVLQPDRFDVIVAPNLFGDILSDLGPACTGTIGLAPSANIDPTGRFPSLLEPVHGSAPDIAGSNIANPVAAIWSAALMLKHARPGEPELLGAHDLIIDAVTRVLRDGPHTPDLGGDAATSDVGSAVANAITHCATRRMTA